ncbi:kinase [Bacillus sp. AFS002410]|uniref:carbohydrate kinase family protein n=1 Tax=Bacillus sp. AFS002410 TaxID=2033481 RepID=UPI000BF0DF5D|nr:carbohydrate kinase family protein [Bacillus sp. AFS002410]PEJ60165.1 kinase [Bacillus sp. AFS002410]
MTIPSNPYILVFGVSICDIIGFTKKNYRPYDSNPGSVKVSFGGVCRNIAENMAKVNLNTKFISVIGDDINGMNMLNHAKNMNIDMEDTLIINGESTPTYLAILNESGEMVSAVVDLDITNNFTKEFIDTKEEVIRNAEYMVVDADNPSTLAYLLTNFHNETKFILDPVSASKASKIRDYIKYFHTIKPNRHEAEVLAGFEITSVEDVRKAGRYFRELGVTNVFISLDAEGIYYNNGIEEGIVQADGVSVVNVTGAGDALVAGIGYGYMNNMSIVDTVKYSVSMSTITISHVDTINPNMCCNVVEHHINEINWVEMQF